MEIRYHPQVRHDLREILSWYDSRSDRAGDRFFAEFESTVQALLSDKLQGFLIDEFARKILLKKFPYSITYEVDRDTLYVFVVKHQKRRPGLGMQRNRPSRNT